MAGQNAGDHQVGFLQLLDGSQRTPRTRVLRLPIGCRLFEGFLRIDLEKKAKASWSKKEKAIKSAVSPILR